MPQPTQLTVPLDRDELARLGAKQLYAQLQAQLRALADAFPDVIEDNDTPQEERRTRRTFKRALGSKRKRHGGSNGGEWMRTETNTAKANADALVQVLQATMPKNEKLSPSQVLAMVKEQGYHFTGKDEAAALARALAKMAKQKLARRSGHSRGTRYELLSKAG